MQLTPTLYDTYQTKFILLFAMRHTGVLCALYVSKTIVVCYSSHTTEQLYLCRYKHRDFGISPLIPSQEDANDDAVEVEESQPFPITDHSEEEDEDGEDDDDSIGEAIEDESLDLFVDLATMGLDMDVRTCRDLLEDKT